ncbi:YetF domain-containing protein [Carnobacterium sp.]|uniref:DUF421 domain-containing protein n=1 Tax=Carnobacterium sp. TaxID=48221 RepID=UPI0028AD6D2D|nr:YetF domain-containing protein [Carnobacterium sp.]
MKMLFSDWNTVFKILIVGSLAYVLLIIVLRIFGKRTLSKMNAFDFVVTIALGSILSSILTSRDVTLLDGTIAFTLLIFLQYIITKLTIHFQAADKVIKAEPVLLFYKGRFDFKTIEKERLSEEEVLQAVRSKGLATMDNVLAVVLETTGSISVIQNSSKYPENSTLKNINKDHF